MVKHSFDLPRSPEGLKLGPQRAVILKAILPDDPSHSSADIDPLNEIRSLSKTAGVQIVGVVTQKRRRPHASTYVGKGKLEELKELVDRCDADLVLVDDPISPSQGKNIEDRTSLRIVDRSELIMDIFATHARTHQAQLQVELAQLRYLQTRLKRMWSHLSRFEGGIGMRGPGETQLETDRRIIRNKIQVLKKRLRDIERQRTTQNKARSQAFKVVLVGYTNAGKSTLMRQLTGAPVLVEDLLFSTLDTSTRRWELPCSRQVLLSDTVGFIRMLPPGLVASFHATLMEAEEADLLLHVVDGTTPHVEADMAAVQGTLETIGCADKRTFLLFNKIDRLPDERRIDLQFLLASHDNSMVISAQVGTGITSESGLQDQVLKIITSEDATEEYRLPVARGDLLAKLRKLGTIVEECYNNEHVLVSARLAPVEKKKFELLLSKNGIREGNSNPGG